MTLRTGSVAALACVLAGCGGSGMHGAATTGGSGGGSAGGGAIYGDMGSGDTSAAFAACMRRHGVTLGARGPGRVSPTSPKFRRAAAACRSAVPGKSPGSGGGAGS